MPSAITTVFFDAFGTLIYLPDSIGEHYRKIGLRHRLDLSVEALNQAFRSRWKAAPPRANAPDSPRPEDDKGWWRELVRAVIADVASKTAWEHVDFDAYFEELYAHFAQPGVWAAFPEAIGVLARLQASGFQLGVISNFDRRLYPIFDGLALRPYFAHIIISSEVGADKPNPIIFQTALRRTGVSASEAVHVGDEPESDWGAEAVGMEVFKLRRPEQTLDGLPRWLTDRSPRENGLASGRDVK